MLLQRTAAAVMLTTLVTLPGCDSTDDGGSNGISTNPTLSCDGAGAESSITNGHTHAVCVPATDINAPSVYGGTYVTTFVDGHTHTVNLTQAQLLQLAAGPSVTTRTTASDDHTHVFVLLRSTAAATTRGPAMSPL
jgi:hypothetical protein